MQKYGLILRTFAKWNKSVKEGQILHETESSILPLSCLPVVRNRTWCGPCSGWSRWVALGGKLLTNDFPLRAS